MSKNPAPTNTVREKILFELREAAKSSSKPDWTPRQMPGITAGLTFSSATRAH